MQFLEQKCISCGRCAAVCTRGCHTMDDGRRRYDRAPCASCGECAARDVPFYMNSGGGLTCPGGEPMLRIDFLRGQLCGARTLDLHIAVGTAGNVPFHFFEATLPMTDLFHYDIKRIDDDKHIRATGASNRLILKNLNRVSEAGAAIWVRIPIIPGINDRIDTMVRMADFLQMLHGIERVELLAFHRLGGGKHESLGRIYSARDLVPATKEEMTALSRPFIDGNRAMKIS